MTRRVSFLALCAFLLVIGVPGIVWAAPTGTMALSGGAYCVTSVSTTISSSVLGATLMRYRIDGGSWTAQVPYEGALPIVLPSVVGTRHVTAEYDDGLGGVLTVEDEIVLDLDDPYNSPQAFGAYDPSPLSPVAGVVDVSTDPDDVFLQRTQAWVQAGSGLEVTLTCNAPMRIRVWRDSGSGPQLLATSSGGAGLQHVSLIMQGIAGSSHYLDVQALSGGGSYRLEWSFPLRLKVQPTSMTLYASKGHNSNTEKRYFSFLGQFDWDTRTAASDAITVTENCSWLSAMKADEMMGDPYLVASASCSTMKLGSYHTTVTVFSPLAANPPIAVPVTLKVLRPTCVKLTQASTSVTYGSRMKFTVDVRRADTWSSKAPLDPHAKIQVLQNISGGYDVVRTITTDGRGRATFYLGNNGENPLSTVKVRRVRGSTYNESTSATRYLRLKWRCLLRPEATRVATGQWVTLRMFLDPHLGGTLKLQVNKGRGWRFWNSYPCMDVVSTRLRGRGSWRFRLYKPASKGYLAGYSAVKRITWD